MWLFDKNRKALNSIASISLVGNRVIIDFKKGAEKDTVASAISNLHISFVSKAGKEFGHKPFHSILQAKQGEKVILDLPEKVNIGECLKAKIFRVGARRTFFKEFTLVIKT